MKILVCMSVVPDTTTKISFIENNTKFNTQGVQFIINPYDELSLTKAIEIAEKNGGTVTVATVGLSDTEPVIRKALAIGANDAIRVNAEPKDGLQVASLLADIVKSNAYDLVLTGRESIDYNGGQICGLLAELLSWPAVNVCTKIEFENGNMQFERDIDGGRQNVTCSLPVIASAQKDLCEPRIPNMKGIMAARTKPLSVIEPNINETGSEYFQFENPVAKQAVRMIDANQAGDLINILKNEIKILS
ncbi:MAG: electron transfer flavoprotein subunit beta/FixA family protein [Bacteroidota bacterium]|nr:electron transfer flavoprotein subunit beta/FixA family protein [Bacteroidota bacterium]